MEIPFELLEEIFYYLDHEDLWRCLAVSKRWRAVANTNRLWKIHCNKLRIEEPSKTSFSDGDNNLCLWASTYVTHFLMPIRNWKTGNCKVFDIAIYDTHFIDIWEGNLGAVYYYKIDKLLVYEIDDEVKCVELSCFKNLPRELFTISIGLARNYIAISNYNVVIVFKRNCNVYETFKVAAYHNDMLLFKEYDEEFIKSVFSFDLSLQIKTFFKEFLWINGNFIDYLYVIDVSSDKIISYGDLSYFRSAVHSPYVANWDEDEIRLYNCSGKIVFQTDVKCWDLCFNKDILVIGNKDLQTIETWNIRTGTKILSKNVLYQTDIVIHPKKNVLVLAEKSKVVYRFTCIDAINGNIKWHLFPAANKKRSHDLKIVSNYVFIWHLFLSRPTYTILDISNGKPMSEGLLPENKCHLSDFMWVYLDYDHFKIKSFIGSLTNLMNQS